MAKLSPSILAPTAERGAWAVAVSGGADSVALLLMLSERRKDLQLRAIHLDHELRGRQSAEEGQFVAALARRLGWPCELARRSDIERQMGKLPANKPARYRAVRLALFAQVASKFNLAGVMVAHHADDLAETVLHRLIRGAAVTGLCPMREESRVDGLRVVRPLLAMRTEELRQYLISRGQEWREDPSNASADYLRNRLRKILATHPGLTPALLEIAHAAGDAANWIAQTAPRLEAEFAAIELARTPPLLARHAARQWLIGAGSPAEQISTAVADRLVEMAADAATAGRQYFPGRVLVRRRAGIISGQSLAQNFPAAKDARSRSRPGRG
ncbi:MAG TPA: tRNA lysidine(34) synthetase TilS [Tepidisphaeraceae bacterium]|nr:tRNA lysidine(34) synthetase TilS [Tepidisphaeraceae bacterium]